MDPIVVQGLMMIAGVFLVPTLAFVVFFMWIEQRELVEQNVALQERLASAHEAEAVAWSDGYDAARWSA